MSLYKIGAFAILIAVLFAATGCAKRQAIMPDYSGYGLSKLLSELTEIRTIESALEVDYERGDAAIGGDMFIKVDEGSMTVRVYYMGFPAGELIEDRGNIIKNTIKVGRARAEMLIEGLKASIFWWRSVYDETLETDGAYILRGLGSEVIIDKKILLPISQRFVLQNGDSVDITYSEPMKVNPNATDQRPTDWYQSVMTIEYRNYKVRARIRSLSVKSHSG